MRMDIKLANGTNIILQYEQFKVASAKDKYKLTVGGFQGTTTDPMAYHNGMYTKALKTMTMTIKMVTVHYYVVLKSHVEDGGMTAVIL